MSSPAQPIPVRRDFATSRLLAWGRGWSVRDELCRAGPQSPVFEEQHPAASISAVLSGHFLYRSAQGRSLMPSGSLLLGNRGAHFCCTHEHGSGDRCVAFHFEPELWEEIAAEIPGVLQTTFPVCRVSPVPALLPLLSDIRTLADGGHADGGEELALRMAGAAFRLASGGRDPHIQSRDERRIAHVLRFIHAQLAEPLTVAALAVQVEMSPYHFLRTFHRVVGETPYRYILGRRLLLAAQSLSTTRDRVLDIALACGFTDLSEFTRAFHARFGMSPAAYRRRKQSAEGSILL